MTQLVEEGKIRAAGVSNFDVSLLARCEAVRHVDALQPPSSLIRREVGGHEIPWCAAPPSMWRLGAGSVRWELSAHGACMGMLPQLGVRGGAFSRRRTPAGPAR
jgi:hypothetical protein